MLTFNTSVLSVPNMIAGAGVSLCGPCTRVINSFTLDSEQTDRGGGSRD